MNHLRQARYITTGRDKKRNRTSHRISNVIYLFMTCDVLSSPEVMRWWICIHWNQGQRIPHPILYSEFRCVQSLQHKRCWYRVMVTGRCIMTLIICVFANMNERMPYFWCTSCTSCRIFWMNDCGVVFAGAEIFNFRVPSKKPSSKIILIKGCVLSWFSTGSFFKIDAPFPWRSNT
jgi:hypothetical protein